MQDKKPRNSKGQRHGYWEYYWSDSQLGFKCYFINGVKYGYEELYWVEAKLFYKHYYAR